MNIKKRLIIRIILFSLVVILSSSMLIAKGHRRTVKLIWKREGPKTELTLSIKEAGKKEALKEKISINRPVTRIPIILTKSDEVEISMIVIDQKVEELDIDYEITAPKSDTRMRSSIAEILKIPTTAEEAEAPKEASLWVTDDLIPGGDLTIVFKEKYKSADKEPDEKKIRFKIKYEHPWFFTSTGCAFTNESNHDLAIINTNNIITFVKDGETRSACEQMIIFKDKKGTEAYDLRPKQTLVQFIHFKINKGFYFTFGTPLDKFIFVEPFVGFSGLFRSGKYGFVLSTGVHFHKEVEILEVSGFKENQVIDPTLGLTVDDIPTKETYQVRFFIGLSFRI